MTSLTNYGERQLLGVLLGTAWSPSLTVGLGTLTAGDAENPTIIPLSGDGYAAQALTAANWTAAATTTYTADPCGTGGLLFYRSLSEYNAAVTFPVATAQWSYDCRFFHDGTDYVAVEPAGTTLLGRGYQASYAAGDVTITLDFSSTINCPLFSSRGQVTQLGQRKLLDNLTGRTPWTPVPHLAIRNNIAAPTETHFVDTSGLWDAPATDGSGRAASALNTTVDFAVVASTFTIPTVGVQLTDGAAYTTEIGTFGLTSGTGAPTLNAGDFLRIAANRLIMRLAS